MMSRFMDQHSVRLARPVVSATASLVVLLMYAFLLLVGGSLGVTLLRWWRVGDVPRLSVVSAAVGVTVVVVLGVAVLARLTSSSLSLRRSRFLPASVASELSRIQQASFLGVGGLAGWTATNPSVSMSDLISPPPVEAVERFLQLASEEERTASRVAVATGDAGSPQISKLGDRLKVATLPPPNYEVARGDTYWLLAERAFGDGNRWAEIRELNLGRRVDEESVIEPGTDLRRGWLIAVPATLEEEYV